MCQYFHLSPSGDEVEQQAILSVFGAEICQRLAVSSTKGATGHLLGAAGAVEIVSCCMVNVLFACHDSRRSQAFTALALHHGLAPPTVNLMTPQPHLLQGLVRHGQARPLPPGPKAAMCNSFGFGGTNACLLLATSPN